MVVWVSKIKSIVTCKLIGFVWGLAGLNFDLPSTQRVSNALAEAFSCCGAERGVFKHVRFAMWVLGGSWEFQISSMCRKIIKILARLLDDPKSFLKWFLNNTMAA